MVTKVANSRFFVIFEKISWTRNNRVVICYKLWHFILFLRGSLIICLLRSNSQFFALLLIFFLVNFFSLKFKKHQIASNFYLSGFFLYWKVDFNSGIRVWLALFISVIHWEWIIDGIFFMGLLFLVFIKILNNRALKKIGRLFWIF